MRAFLVLVRLRLAEVGRSLGSIFFIFVFPPLLLLIVGVVFYTGHPFERHRLVVVCPDRAAHAEPLAALAAMPGVRIQYARSEAAGKGELQSRMARGVVICSEPGRWRLLIAASDEIFARGMVAAPPRGTQFTYEIEAVPRWGYVLYLFPGLLTFTVLLAGVYGMGYHMVRFRHNLFLRKLATTPLPRATFVAALIAGRGVLILVQAGLLTLAAVAVFGLSLSLAGLAWLAMITLLGVLTFLGLGFVLACFFRSEDAINDAIGTATMPLVLLSEIFFPVDDLPAGLPALAAVMPSTQMVRLLRSVLLHGETQAGPLLIGVLILAAWMVMCYVASVLAFNWND